MVVCSRHTRTKFFSVKRKGEQGWKEFILLKLIGGGRGTAQERSPIPPRYPTPPGRLGGRNIIHVFDPRHQLCKHSLTPVEFRTKLHLHQPNVPVPLVNLLYERRKGDKGLFILQGDRK